MLDEALIYLDMGWCVYPAHRVDPEGRCTCGQKDCPCPGKHPIGRWTEFQDRLPYRREVRLWFGTMDCNVGAVTGRVSGIVVVDADGVDGLNSVRKLNLEPTLTARTGGGGYHFFYMCSDPVETRTRVLPGVDLRADGGYIILPPSIHRSGNRYEWLEPKQIAYFDPTPFERKSLNGHTVSTGWSAELWQGVSEGSRSNSTAKLAGKYFGMGLSTMEVWILVSAWNERNDPPLPENELKRTVDWARRKHEEVSLPIQINTISQIRSILLEGGQDDHK